MDTLTNLPLLSLLIIVPIMGGILVLCMNDQQIKIAHYFALLIAVLSFALSILLYMNFDMTTQDMQFVEHAGWIDTFNINYALGIDGISLLLIMLTNYITILVILLASESVKHRVTHYLSAFLLLAGLMNGVFMAQDAILFYVFWEAMLIPMFIIIGVWGGERRVYATIKFFLYTFLGSVFMLLALLYLYTQADSFAIKAMQDVALDIQAQKLIFIAFLLAFAVKIPMWPLHTWLPDAHVEAPTGGSVILAAIMLKMGGYGFLRFSLPITPDASLYFTDMMIVLSLIAIVYIGFVALAQEDMKKLIAYSSISHMGFVSLGFFIPFSLGVQAQPAALLAIEGGMMQMLSHGFISAAMFFCVGIMYHRMHSRNISDYGGVINTMPYFSAFMLLFTMANCGLPGTSGFVGEFAVILASFQANIWIALLSALTLILGAAYSLWMYKRVIFGPATSTLVLALDDINLREAFVLACLAITVLWFGLLPAPIFTVMDPTMSNLLDHIMQSKL